MAQRVGAIANYRPASGNSPATFEVIEPGKDKGLKCVAWPNVGGRDNPRPNSVVVALNSMSAVDLVGPWLVGGYERQEEFDAKDGTHVQTRRFYATDITKAAPGAKNEFDMDKDGNLLEEGLKIPASAASAVSVPLTSGSDNGDVIVGEWALGRASECFAAGRLGRDEIPAFAEVMVDWLFSRVVPHVLACRSESIATTPGVPAASATNENVVPADAWD